MTRVRRPCTLGAWLVPKREIFTIRCSNASHYYNLLHLHVLRRGRLLIGSGVVAGTERKLQLWTVLPSGERQGREVSGRGAPTGRLSFQRSSRIPRGERRVPKCPPGHFPQQRFVPAQVQKARLQDDILGREAAEELAHPCQPAPLPRLRAQRPGGEDNEDVLERTRPELPLPRFRWYVFRVFLTSRHLTSRFQRLP
jgi:hypothetical protein